MLIDMTQHLFGGTYISLFERDSLAKYFVVLRPTYYENVIEIRLQFFCNVVSKYGPRKFKDQSRLPLVSYSTCPENFMKIH